MTAQLQQCTAEERGRRIRVEVFRLLIGAEARGEVIPPRVLLIRIQMAVGWVPEDHTDASMAVRARVTEIACLDSPVGRHAKRCRRAHLKVV